MALLMQTLTLPSYIAMHAAAKKRPKIRIDFPLFFLLPCKLSHVCLRNEFLIKTFIIIIIIIIIKSPVQNQIAFPRIERTLFKEHSHG